MAMTVHASELIDLHRYPIDQPGTPAFGALIAGLRDELARDGCAVLKRFIRAEGLGPLVAEADSVAERAHRSHNRTNAYFSKDDDSLPETHPVRRFFDRSNAFIPADNFAASSPLRSIYQFDPFMPFIRLALNEPEARFFRYDDPLADVIINMVEDGDGFPWHFDTNNYTVTLAIQNAEFGGDFEYVAGLRTPTDENYSRVQAILDGERQPVSTLVLEPGDLQIFKGRYALHRVTPVAGSRRRYVGIFSFVEKEGMCGGVERSRQLYGRVLPIHYQREGLRDDALRD